MSIHEIELELEKMRRHRPFTVGEKAELKATESTHD